MLLKRDLKEHKHLPNIIYKNFFFAEHLQLTAFIYY